MDAAGRNRGVVLWCAWARASAFQAASPYISIVFECGAAAFNPTVNLQFGDSSLPPGRPQQQVRIGSATAKLAAPTTCDAGVWYHLACVYDGEYQRIYIDGDISASAAQSGALAATSDPINVGRSPAYGRYFAGAIDDVMLYTAALTQEQIADIITNSPGSHAT